jgi:hypothetical protein
MEYKKIFLFDVAVAIFIIIKQDFKNGPFANYDGDKQTNN